MAKTEIIPGPKCLGCQKELKPNDQVITVKSTLGKPVGWVCSRDCWHTIISDKVKSLIRQKGSKKPNPATMCPTCGLRKKKDKPNCHNCAVLMVAAGFDLKTKPAMLTKDLLTQELLKAKDIYHILEDIKRTVEDWAQDAQDVLDHGNLTEIKKTVLESRIDEWETIANKLENVI